jgi:hypothetical protein
VLSLQRAGIGHISIRQHGDSVSEKFVNGMAPDARERLFEMTVDPVPRHGIVICHSEPGRHAIPNRIRLALVGD